MTTERTVWLTTPRTRTEACTGENTTPRRCGWSYPMGVCVCGCTCRDQRHCGTEKAN